MVTKWGTYRAACIFELADAGLTVKQIEERQDAIADGFSEGLMPDELVKRVMEGVDERALAR